MTSLKQELYRSEFNDEEFQVVVLNFFGRCYQIDERSYGYGQIEGSPEIIIEFSAKGKVKKIEPGSSFEPKKVVALRKCIQHSLVKKGPLGIGRKIMFASSLLKGCYRYQDRFQILPVPDEAPLPPHGMGGFPFQIEASFSGSPDFAINSLRSRTSSHEVGLLCATLLGPRVYSGPSQTNFYWVLNVGDDGAADYKFQQEGYGWAGMPPQTVDYFSKLDDFESAQFVDAQTYYTSNATELDQSLALPVSLTHSLDAYFNLSEDNRKRFLTSCHWFNQSSQIWMASKSAYYVALVSAIEALLPEPDHLKCPKCEKPIGKGVTQHFIDFIEQFVPDEAATPSDRKKLYNIRSSIAHGRKVLSIDGPNSFAPFAAMREMSDLRTLLATVRIALINWLLSQHSQR